MIHKSGMFRQLLRVTSPRPHHPLPIRSFSKTVPRCTYRSQLMTDRRACVSVSGDEAALFLQGLMTNDVHHLTGGPGIGGTTKDDKGDCETDSYKQILLRRSLYTMFLNTKGRVICEAILFHVNDNEFVLDCDRAIANHLIKHLKMYRIRRKIDLDLRDDLNTWVVYDSESSQETEPQISTLCNHFQCMGLELNTDVDAICSSDPRLKALGFRLLAPMSNDKLHNQLSDMSTSRDISYEGYRYRLGVSEGSQEVISGKVTPLEYNADYMHGVSFHKGCYVGQELTARTHHTGVIRKRIMPLAFDAELPDPSTLVDGTVSLDDQNGKSVGKLCGFAENHALGLMRIEESLNAEKISLQSQPNVSVKVTKPSWWPKPSQKRSPTNSPLEV